MSVPTYGYGGYTIYMNDCTVYFGSPGSDPTQVTAPASDSEGVAVASSSTGLGGGAYLVLCAIGLGGLAVAAAAVASSKRNSYY